jgi:hypothetical protein
MFKISSAGAFLDILMGMNPVVYRRLKDLLLHNELQMANNFNAYLILTAIVQQSVNDVTFC